METIIGFVVGYLVGAREGKDGVERLKTSVSSIIGSAEARRMLAEAVAVAEEELLPVEQPVVVRSRTRAFQ